MILFSVSVHPLAYAHDLDIVGRTKLGAPFAVLNVGLPKEERQ